MRAGPGRGAVAARPFAAGEVVIELVGRLTDRPAFTSLQVAEELHLDLPRGASDWVIERDHSWRFINHGCDPNLRLGHGALLAVRDIARGEAVHFDYETTEAHLARPFRCSCEAATCRRAEVRGFDHLSPAEREARRALLAPHLRRRLDAATMD